MKMKMVLMLVAGVVISQAGCSTKIRSMPMPAEALTQTKQGVKLYFADEPHANVTKLIETKEVRAKVARDPNDPQSAQEKACNAALGEALAGLRDYARAKKADAVVNVTTRFQRKETSSSKEFMCGSSLNASTIAVRGDVVLLDEK
jgi:uncharacterized protein YbjQ (UPF0145 family)